MVFELMVKDWFHPNKSKTCQPVVYPVVGTSIEVDQKDVEHMRFLYQRSINLKNITIPNKLTEYKNYFREGWCLKLFYIRQRKDKYWSISVQHEEITG